MIWFNKHLSDEYNGRFRKFAKGSAANLGDVGQAVKAELAEAKDSS